MYYEPQNDKSSLYAVVDADTHNMYIWSIDSKTMSLTKATAVKTIAMPVNTWKPRGVKGYDPVSKDFYLLHENVIKRGKVNAQGNALDIYTPPGGNATFYSAVGAVRANGKDVRANGKDVRANGKDVSKMVRVCVYIMCVCCVCVYYIYIYTCVCVCVCVC